MVTSPTIIANRAVATIFRALSLALPVKFWPSVFVATGPVNTAVVVPISVPEAPVVVPTTIPDGPKLTIWPPGSVAMGCCRSRVKVPITTFPLALVAVTISPPPRVRVTSEALVTGSVRVPAGSIMTTPLGPILIVVPDIVIAGSPGLSVVPGPRIRFPLGSVVMVRGPSVIRTGPTVGLLNGIVRVPEVSITTTPLVPTLNVVPDIVMGFPPGATVVDGPLIPPMGSAVSV